MVNQTNIGLAAATFCSIQQATGQTRGTTIALGQDFSLPLARYVSVPPSRENEAADNYPAGNGSPRQVLLQIRRHPTSHYAPTDESEFHLYFFRQVAVTNCGAYSFFPSISAISSSVRLRSAAPTFPSTCFALRAPTMAPVTVGFRKVQAIAICPGGRQ